MSGKTVSVYDFRLLLAVDRNSVELEYTALRYSETVSVANSGC